MTKSKKLCVSLLVLTIDLLCCSFILLDFSRFFGLTGYYDLYYPSAVLKRITVVLATVIVWIAGKDSLNRKDHWSMKFAFIMICIAETAFLFRKVTAGVVFFASCQALLTIRNSKGIKPRLASASAKQKSRLKLLGLAIVASLAAAVSYFYPTLVSQQLLLLVCFYGIFLSMSLWMGLSNYVLGLLPLKNSKLVAAGMTCFYFCDFMVGLDAILKPGLVWLIANSFIWVFYTPAITLLALSSYHYDE